MLSHSLSLDSDQEFVIRAISNDNHRDAERTAELFRQSYLTSYPVGDVYNPDFWLADPTNLDADELTPITSVVAVHRNRFVAHLGLKRRPLSETVEIVFPAIHPVYRAHVFTLSRLLWQSIEEQARRQRWHAIFHFSLMTHPMWQLIAAKCFGSQHVAIVPNERATAVGIRRPESRRSFLIMFNTFNTSAIPRLVLYPPDRHADLLMKMYESLRIPRTFRRAGADLSPQLVQNDMALEAPEMLKKMECNVQLLSLEAHHLCEGKALAATLSNVSRSDRTSTIIRVPLESPLCPSFCEYLEEQGMRLCGLLPMVNGTDSILYGAYEDSALDDLTLYSRDAKALRSYLLGKVSESAGEC